MKIILVLLLLSTPAHAFDEWDTEDIALQTIFTIEALIDWKQTKTFVKNGGTETNPLLGKHPSQGKIDLLIGSSIILHAGISHVLPSKYRHYWQLIFIGIETQSIHNNYQTGVRIQF